MSPRCWLLPWALALALAPASAEAANGRDVSFGYRWYDTDDGATPGPGLFDPIAAVTTVQLPNDGPPLRVTLPWGFRFYGALRPEIWISDNGWIGLTDPAGDAHPLNGWLPDPAPPVEVIAPFWSDLDCSNPLAGHQVKHGPVNSHEAYRVQYSCSEVLTGAIVSFDTYLYRDGRIKAQYQFASSFAPTTVGIENQAGDDGFSVVDHGVPAPDVPLSPPRSYVVDVLPPPVLGEECGLLPAVSCGVVGDSLPGTLPENVALYGCGPTELYARERVYALTLPEGGRLRATLAPGSATNLVLMLVEHCNERRCFGSSGTGLDVLLGPGTYDLVVDAPSQDDEGTFTLEIDCQPLGETLACGDTAAGDTTGGSLLIDGTPCGAADLGGAERFYLVDVPAPTNLRATLAAGGAALDLVAFAVRPDEPILPETCLQQGGASVLLADAEPGTYLIGVDGPPGSEGPFTLETACGAVADCSAIAGVIDFAGGNRQPLAGDTTSGVNVVEVYRCDLSEVHDGPELVYEIELPAAGQVGILEQEPRSGLSFFVLDDCDEGHCLGDVTGSCGTLLPAGTHYLVVDGPAGLEGPFAIDLVFDEAFNRWSECESPLEPTTVEDEVRTVWDFDDGAYCYADPDSHNYPDGCTFAMYVSARCGTELHIPLQDVESGHVRVYDVFRSQPVELTAESTGGWSQTGFDISWQDCVGNDPRWNDQTTDIWFRRDQGLCGVYRLEFPGHSGFVWSLYANCTGSSVGGYPVFDSLCGAVAAFEPLPNLSLLEASIALDCPDVEVTYTIVNDGCAAAEDVEVTLLDNGVPVHVDTIPVVGPASSEVRTFSATFPGGGSTTNVTLEVDVADRVAECDETPGSGCALTAGQDAIRLEDCGPDCDVVARAEATPSAICETGTTTIDASASTFVDCPSGSLEYRLTGPAGTTPWQASPAFPGLAPTETTDYEVEVRCSDPALSDVCLDVVALTVGVERAPIFDAASVTAEEVDCEIGVRLEWAPATFRGPTGRGVYNVYRSTVSCADAVDPASPTGRRVATMAGTAYGDATTLPGQTYHYVVEAEDETGFPGGCVPDGPTFGGATSRADVPGGTCAAIVERVGPDTSLLPRVGGTLRVGAPDAYSATVVPLRWDADAPLDAAADEHFHVLRSSSPVTGFTQLNLPDPPLLQDAAFVDAEAGSPGPGSRVQHYLVFTSNACHFDNRAFDP